MHVIWSKFWVDIIDVVAIVLVLLMFSRASRGSRRLWLAPLAVLVIYVLTYLLLAPLTGLVGDKEFNYPGNHWWTDPWGWFVMHWWMWLLLLAALLLFKRPQVALAVSAVLCVLALIGAQYYWPLKASTSVAAQTCKDDVVKYRELYLANQRTNVQAMEAAYQRATSKQGLAAGQAIEAGQVAERNTAAITADMTKLQDEMAGLKCTATAVSAAFTAKIGPDGWVLFDAVKSKGDFLTYSWLFRDLNDPSAFMSNSNVVGYHFANPGKYAVQLTVTDWYGQSAAYPTDAQSQADNPLANFLVTVPIWPAYAAAVGDSPTTTTTTTVTTTAAAKPKPQPAPACPSGSWKTVSDVHAGGSLLTNGVPSIVAAKTDAQAKAAALSWIELVKTDKTNLAGAVKYLLHEDVNPAALVTANGTCASKQAAQKVIQLKAAIAHADSIKVRNAPKDGYNSGVKNGRVVSDANSGIAGNLKSVQIVLNDGSIVWILGRCGNPVTVR